MNRRRTQLQNWDEQYFSKFVCTNHWRILLKENSESAGLGLGLRFSISGKLLSDTYAVSLGITFLGIKIDADIVLFSLWTLLSPMGRLTELVVFSPHLPFMDWIRRMTDYRWSTFPQRVVWCSRLSGGQECFRGNPSQALSGKSLSRLRPHGRTEAMRSMVWLCGWLSPL